MTPAPAEDFAFIEVGGEHLEASPAVLACAVPPREKAPPRKPESRPALKASASVPARATASVAFRAVPLLGSVRAAKDRFAPELIAFHEPEHAVSQEYRSLLARLLESASGGGPNGSRALLLCGAAAGISATTVALNLAITCAKQGKRILAVDACITRPALPEKLGLSPAPGLREVLAGVVSWRRAIQETGLSNLQALTAGELARRPWLPITSLKAAFNLLKKYYDLVVVDAPAWHGGAEMAALAAACDALFLVLPQDQADSTETKELLQALPAQRLPLRGCILTR